MPEFLEKMLEKQYGVEIKNQILQGYEEKRKVTFRVNTLKSSVSEVEILLKSLKIEYQNSIFN